MILYHNNQWLKIWDFKKIFHLMPGLNIWVVIFKELAPKTLWLSALILFAALV